MCACVSITLFFVWFRREGLPAFVGRDYGTVQEGRVSLMVTHIGFFQSRANRVARMC